MAATRRRAARAVSRSARPAQNQIVRAATGPAARALYVTVGTLGLAALAVALFGPKRFHREIVQPVRQAVGEQAERLWADSRPLRDDIGRLFERAQTESGREKLARNFQSWIGHFRAS